MKVRKLLCVDDEEAVLDVLQITLTGCGYAVFTSTDGIEAIEIARREGIRVFLLDLRMPTMNGIELCQRLREQDADAAIYVLSAYVGSYTPQQFESAGFDGGLVKPFALAQLEEVCRSAFEKVEGGPDHVP